MVRPFQNMTIKGALWYQGENNVFQCHGSESNAQGANSGSGGPFACGTVETKTGYACMMENLVNTWREARKHAVPLHPPPRPCSRTLTSGQCSTSVSLSTRRTRVSIYSQ